MPRRDVERGDGAGVVAERYQRGCFPVICTIAGWLEGARAVVREKSRSDKGVASKVAPFRGTGRAGRKEGDT